MKTKYIEWKPCKISRKTTTYSVAQQQQQKKSAVQTQQCVTNLCLSKSGSYYWGTVVWNTEGFLGISYMHITENKNVYKKGNIYTENGKIQEY